MPQRFKARGWTPLQDAPPEDAPEAVYELYYRNHPVEFAQRFLGIDLWSAQRDILNLVARHPRVAVRAGHAVGKSFISAAALLWFLHTRPRSIGLLTAPTYDQMRGVVYKEVRRIAENSAKPLPINLLTREIRMKKPDGSDYPDWFIKGFSSDRGDRIQGQHAPGGVFLVMDEAPGISLEIWESAQTLPTTGDSRILLIGNPTRADGFFADAFRGKGDFETYKISVYSSPNFTGERVPRHLNRALVDQSKIAPMISSYGKDSSYGQALLDAEVPEEGEDAVFPRAWIERAQAREPNPDWETDRVMGIDPAHMGADRSVWMGIYGHRVTLLRSEGKTPDMIVAGEWTANAVRLNSIRLVGIDQAMGLGIAGTLRRHDISCMEVNFGGEADDKETFANKRAEMHWRAREFLRDHAILPKDLPGEFIEELFAVRYIYDESRIKIERKEEIRKRLGRSTDYVDAFILAVEMLRANAGLESTFSYYGV